MVVLHHVPAVSRHVLQAGGGQMGELGAVCKHVLQMPKHGMQTDAANVNWGGIMSRVSLVPTVSIMNV